MAQPLSDRLRLAYSSVNEDWRTEAAALRLGPDARVLCVTGSGARPLDLLAVTPARVVAIDVNPAQNHLLELRVGAMRALQFDAYTAFLGLVPAEPGARTRDYAAVARHLSAAARAFWDERRDLVEAGVLYQGRFERTFRKMGQLGHALRPHLIDRLFAFDDLEEQRRFVAEHWDTALWRFAFRVVASARVARVALGDPAFFEHAAMPVGPYLFERIRGALDHDLAKDSFMLNLVFRGELGADRPPHLTRPGFERIKDRLDGLSIVTDEVNEHLRTCLPQSYTHFSLSDVPSYMTRAEVEELFGAVLRAGRPGARVVVRQFLTRYEVAAHLAPYFDREPRLEAKLAREDRAFAYEFIIATIRTRRAATASPTIDELTESDEEEALAIERACVQGESLRLSFHRERFRRRAESFDDHVLLAARIGGKLVGTAAVAFKDVVVRGEPMRASFYFDLRVHPDHRGRGIARHLGTESFVQGFSRSDLGYTYTVDDNRAVLHMIGTSGMQAVGAYAYLVLPTYRTAQPSAPARPATLSEVHERMLAQAGPFDLYTDPRRGGRLDGHVASFLLERGDAVAGCSVWDNRPILAEVVEALPAALRVAGLVLRSPPFAGHGPHLPEAGEVLRSWYVFDAFASDGQTARDLVRHVLAEARAHDIDFCYLIHGPQARWIDVVRADFPRAFAPLVRYRLLGAWQRRGRLPKFESAYVDVRDL